MFLWVDFSDDHQQGALFVKLAILPMNICILLHMYIYICIHNQHMIMYINIYIYTHTHNNGFVHPIRKLCTHWPILLLVLTRLYTSSHWGGSYKQRRQHQQWFTSTSSGFDKHQCFLMDMFIIHQMFIKCHRFSNQNDGVHKLNIDEKIDELPKLEVKFDVKTWFQTCC